MAQSGDLSQMLRLAQPAQLVRNCAQPHLQHRTRLGLRAGTPLSLHPCCGLDLRLLLGYRQLGGQMISISLNTTVVGSSANRASSTSAR